MFSFSCAIPDSRKEFLYITGNWMDYNSKQVTQYGSNGFQSDLPELNTGRYWHACAGYHMDEDHFVLLVVGGCHGKDGHVGRVPSTEIFVVGFSSEWTDVSPRPLSLIFPRASTVNNVIYLTGEANRHDGWEVN